MAKVIARIKDFELYQGKGASARFFIRHDIGIKAFFDRNDCAKACRLQMIAHEHGIAPQVYGFGKVEDATGKQWWGYLTEVATVMSSLPGGVQNLLYQTEGYRQMKKVAQEIGCAHDCHESNMGFVNAHSYVSCKFVVIDFGWHSRHSSSKSTTKSPRSLSGRSHYNLNLLLKPPTE